jgi:hypothetical protein
VAREILTVTTIGIFQIFLFLAIVLAITKPIGMFLARVFSREKTILDPLCRPVERLIYRLCGINDAEEMNWKQYGFAMLLFSAVSLLLLYILERAQHFLPLNPHRFAGVAPTLAWNTAVSFTTNTNWQAYVPEITMSYLTQMVGLAYHNFASAAVGIALAIALIRGISRVNSQTIGNFWVDTTRATLWVLLPACFVLALVLVSQGVIQNFHPYQPVSPLDARVASQQVIPQGPVASQEAIKELGTNGGGFFNANSAHPYENPTPFTNFLQIIMILAIPSGLTCTLGRMTGSPRHGWAVWGAMAALFLVAVFAVYAAESHPTPALNAATTAAAAGNLEGKELRFGIAGSAIFATATTDGSLSNTWAPSAKAGTDPCPSQFPTGTSCGPVSNGGTGAVHSMAFAPDGNSIYVGGNFYYMNGVPRNALAKVSATDGSLVDWRVPWATIPSEGPGNPYVGPNVVWAILPTAARLYIAWGRTPNGFTAFTNTTTTAGSGECSNLPMGNGCVTRLWSQGTPGNAESLALSPDGSRLFAAMRSGTLRVFQMAPATPHDSGPQLALATPDYAWLAHSARVWSVTASARSSRAGVLRCFKWPTTGSRRGSSSACPCSPIRDISRST